MLTLRPTQKPYRIGLLFTYEMLLSSQFLQRTGGAEHRGKTSAHASTLPVIVLRT